MANFTGIRAAWAALSRAAQKVPGGVARVSERAIGRWNWQPPAWLAWSGRRVAQAVCYVAADKKRAGIVLIALLGMAGGWLWYKSRPVPHYVTYTISAPGLTEYGDKGISSIKPLAVQFSESAAPLQQVEKTVTAGIDISPRIAGAWFWVDDKVLQFTPKNDWPIDGGFAVTFARKGFSPVAYTWKTPALNSAASLFPPRSRRASSIRTLATPT